VRALLVVLVTFGYSAVASAQEAEPEASAPSAAIEPEPVATQEIGARLGAQVGFPSLGHGGFRIGGIYMYRLDDAVWFDAEAATVFGSNARECYYSRAESLSLVCEHAGFDGFGVSASGGVRYFLPRRASGFHPYVRAGIGLSWEGFSADDVHGVGLYVHGGAGGRFRVSPRVAVGGEALLLLGPGLYNSDLGARFLGGLVVQLGVELAL
jgi:hypothetical protein